MRPSIVVVAVLTASVVAAVSVACKLALGNSASPVVKESSTIRI